MHATIISSGTEVVTGDVIDTNSAWIAEKLTDMNVAVDYQFTVADDKQKLVWAISQATQMTDVVMITGGLGPTSDDLTRFALAEVAGVRLEERAELVEYISAFFERRGRQMKDVNRVQALMPESAEALENRSGTAPGIAMTIGKTAVFALPGVPSEMRQMFERHVVPWLMRRSRPDKHLLKLYCAGMGESDIVHTLSDIIEHTESHDHVTFGTRVHDGVICLKFYSDQADVLPDIETRVRERLADVVFPPGPTTLPEAIGELLIERGQTLAVAESCTGGYVGQLITDVPGSSAYFLGGWITYSNALKHKCLGVPEELLAEHGAVSEQVAAAMLEGVLTESGATYGITITGIAGPGGGTDEKPVGLVYIAVGTRQNNKVARFTFGDTGREAVRHRAAISALNTLRLILVR